LGVWPTEIVGPSDGIGTATAGGVLDGAADAVGRFPADDRAAGDCPADV
jgi:hypothetical protein